MKFYVDKLKLIRKNRKITSDELASKLSVCRSTMSIWENNKRIPSEATIRHIAQVLDIPVNQISDLEPGKTTSPLDISKAATFIDQVLQSDVNQPNPAIQTIINESAKLDKELKKSKLIIEAFISSFPVSFYIKNTNSKYVVVNKIFMDTISFKDKHMQVMGKTDYDFYPKEEAIQNYEEDLQVLTLGEVLNKVEGYIPGTRKKNWGLISKIPILDLNGKVEGLIGTFIDITDRKKDEIYKNIIERCLTRLDAYFWIGRGAEERNGNKQIKDVLYISDNPVKHFLNGKNDISLNEKREYYKSFIVEGTRTFPDFSRSIEDIPTAIQTYKIRDPVSNKIKEVIEVIGYDKQNDLYFGCNYELKYPRMLAEQKQLFINSMNKNKIPESVIKKVIDEVDSFHLGTV